MKYNQQALMLSYFTAAYNIPCRGPHSGHEALAGGRMSPRKTTIVGQLRKAIMARSREESQYAIVKAAGVHTSVMSRFMREDRDISFETAAKLCDYLGLVLSKPRA
jgi:hypothetical protein